MAIKVFNNSRTAAGWAAERWQSVKNRVKGEGGLERNVTVTKLMKRVFTSRLEAERWEKGGDKAIATLAADLKKAKERTHEQGAI